MAGLTARYAPRRIGLTTAGRWPTRRRRGTLDGMSIYEITPTATTFLADEYERWGHHAWSPWFLVVRLVVLALVSGRSSTSPGAGAAARGAHAARRIRQGRGQRGRVPRTAGRAEGNPPLVTAAPRARVRPFAELSRLASPAAGAIRCRGFTRGVAQLGSALRSGRRGRGFESRHPDSRRRRSQALTGRFWSGPFSVSVRSWSAVDSRAASRALSSAAETNSRSSGNRSA